MSCNTVQLWVWHEVKRLSWFYGLLLCFGLALLESLGFGWLAYPIAGQVDAHVSVYELCVYCLADGCYWCQ